MFLFFSGKEEDGVFVSKRTTLAPFHKSESSQTETITIAVVIGGVVAALIIFIGGIYLWKCR